MEEFCNHLGITQHDLISLQSAITISSTKPHQNVSSLKELPKYMLDKIMMLDCTSRKVPQFSKPIPKQNQSLMERLHCTHKNPSDGVHPMDIFLFLFIHCDPIFRQTFITQVSRCQLSIPLVTSCLSSQKPTFYLFALKTLYKDYYDANKAGKSFSVTQEKLPIISFVRIGECGKSQKSEMLNQIIGLPDYFFHRNQSGGVRKRYLLNGTVEIAWLLPRRSSHSLQNVTFTEPHVILNLRGNALHYPNQLNFVSTISTLVYIFVPINKCNQQLSDHLNNFNKDYGQKSVYLLYEGDISRSNELQPIIPEFMTHSPDSVVILNKESLGEDSNNLVTNISSNLKKVEVIKISLDGCIPLSERHSINSDTHELQLMNCQTCVDNIVKRMLNVDGEAESESKSKQLAAVKELMLPLQGDCWSEWAEAKRESHKQNKTFFLEDSE